MKSYTGVRLGLVGRASELWLLRRLHLSRSEARVKHLLDEAGQIEEHFGKGKLSGRRVLEIGAGQCPAQLAYFAQHNECTGIDLELAPRRLTLRACAGMLRRNGVMRLVKTVGRKAMKIDETLDRSVKSHTGVDMRSLDIREMDASKLQFADGTFDVVYSRAVFEHLADPASVVREIRRVLKPEGAAVVYLHLYTSYSGCHDARIFNGKDAKLPAWAHLRPRHRHLIHENTFLNRMRLAEWRKLFGVEWPGCEVIAESESRQSHGARLADIREAGELLDYRDEELLTVTLKAIWRRAPAPMSG